MPLYYVAHRLFSAHDRVLGAQVARQLASAVGQDSVFLPFCDTDEEDLASDCKGRLLFDLDCARLRGITGMIAVLHGPSLDDGVCMEIGFAAAAQIPIVIVSTDFQTYTLASAEDAFTFPDPLLDHLASAVIQEGRLGPPAATGRPDASRFDSFMDRNAVPVQSAAIQGAAALSAAGGQSAFSGPAREALDLVYLEPSPYMNDPMWAAIEARLRDLGWEVHVARRFQPGADPAEAARADWAAATTARLAAVDARGPEAPPGAALVTGACTASGRPVLAAVTPSRQSLAHGREPNWRNLMIQYAVAGRFSTAAEFTVAMDALPCTPT